MNSNTLSLEEIHIETLNVIKEIIRICDENNIKYYFFYGSLLGAVRHNGFIPWDDDCDIVMFRPDFDKFVSYCKNHDLGKYKLCDKVNTENYPYNIPRFSNMEYRYVSTRGDRDFDIGIFVDIYPLDGAGYNKFDGAKKFKNVIPLMKILSVSTLSHYTNNKVGCGFIYRVVRYCAFILSRLFGYKWILKLLDKNQNKFSFEDSSYVCCCTWGNPKKTYKKEWLGDGIKLEFEGILVNCPSFYKTILEADYGNYTELPPEEERTPSHSYYIVKRVN